ncbi:YitT family protein [Rossellomorea vietnamensis]|uniref:YitT family protein n=1 Tax=Rossellomorea vietnamensis TaxID=218284 RepID=A0A5D4MHW4_9BACI|nr:YitT family protein [Rossellomorea vietnamensis]TYS01343.1 YitT family protein [Rossellomorea vietnamensis]
MNDEAIKQQIKSELQHQKMSTKKIIKRAFFVLLGAIMMALGIEVFLVPNMIMDGGIVGISIILYNLTGIKLGVFIFLLNIPFFFLGYKQIGKTFAVSTVFGITILSLATNYLHTVAAFTSDMLLATVFGGIVLGAGVGLVIRYGGALDGSEILAILLNKRFPFSVGEFIMLFNVFIFTWGGFVLGWDRAMYSVLAYVIAFKTIDIVIDGFDESKSAWIISDKDQEIGDAILARLGRGVTYLKGEGGYSGDDKKVIFCIVTRLEEAKLKSIVEEMDPTAFLAVADINEVRGGRFKKRDIH